MYVLNLLVLIIVVFCLAGVVCTLAAAVVMGDRLARAWQHCSEPKARGGRCTSIEGRLMRHTECPANVRRRH
jgi:hypothetical protein